MEFKGAQAGLQGVCAGNLGWFNCVPSLFARDCLFILRHTVTDISAGREGLQSTARLLTKEDTTSLEGKGTCLKLPCLVAII